METPIDLDLFLRQFGVRVNFPVSRIILKDPEPSP